MGKKIGATFACFLTLLILLVGCQKPIGVYKKAVNEILLPSKLNEIELQCQNITQELDQWLRSDATELRDISTDINIYKQMIVQLQEDMSPIKLSDEYVKTVHQYVVNILTIYAEIALKSEEVSVALYDLEAQKANIENTNEQILQAILSGTPTTLTYNQELADFISVHEEALKLFDLESSKQMLERKSLDVELISDALKKSRIIIEEMETLETFSETDEEINKLLVLMYNQIYGMYEYALKNQAIIEWSNQYETFSDYVQEKNLLIISNIRLWEKETELTLEIH